MLTRSADDRKRYDLAGHGSLRKPSWWSEKGEILTVEGYALTATMVGFMQRTAEATDAGGAVWGRYRRTKSMSHGGDIEWRGRAFTIRQARCGRARGPCTSASAPWRR